MLIEGRVAHAHHVMKAVGAAMFLESFDDLKTRLRNFIGAGAVKRLAVPAELKPANSGL
jgi:hypothetical protein